MAEKSKTLENNLVSGDVLGKIQHKSHIWIQIVYCGNAKMTITHQNQWSGEISP